MKQHRGEIADNLIDIVTIDDANLQKDVWESFKKLRPQLKGHDIRWFAYRCPLLAEEALEWGMAQELLDTEDLYWIIANVPTVGEIARAHLQKSSGAFKTECVDQQKLDEVMDLLPEEEEALWKSVKRQPRPDELEYPLEAEYRELLKLVRYSTTYRSKAALRLCKRFRNNESVQHYLWGMTFEDPAIFIALTAAKWQMGSIEPEHRLALDLASASK